MKKDLNLLLAISIISILVLTYISMADLEGVYTGSKLEERNKREFNENSIKNKKIKLAGFWDEDDVAFIHVKNDNWSENSLPWIQVGAGTEADPHIIENVTIDASNSPIGTIYGAELGSSSDPIYMYAGIKLDTSNNGKLIENNCSNNNIGVYLYAGNYNMLKENKVINNTYGIILISGGYNAIIKNNASDNWYGITLFYSNNNNASTNDENDNGYGIVSSLSYFNNISNNVLIKCGIFLDGVNKEHFSSHIINGNTVNEKLIYYYENEKELNDNNFSNAAQVFLVNCNDSLIRNLDLSHASTGIFLYECHNNILTNLNTSHNRYGIYLKNSENNTVSGNDASNSNDGIFLCLSDENTVSGNDASNNYYGIHLESSDNNTVLGNDVKYNTHDSIYLESSHENTILRNNATNNYYSNGIALDYSNKNIILENNVSSNDDNGIFLISSDENMVSGNEVSNNGRYGINSIDSRFNNISNNVLINCGIFLYGDNIEHFTSHVINGNTANEKLIYYYKNEKELNDNNFSNAGQVILINCSNSLIRNLDLSHASIGIFLYKCHNNILTNLNTNHNWIGIYLDNSDNNTVSGNNATHSSYGIELWYSNENTVSGNDASNNGVDGIDLIYSNENTVSGNDASNNGVDGIDLIYSDNNTVSGNDANNNSRYGIMSSYSFFNNISNNVLIKCGISLEGGNIEHFSSHVINGNTVNEKLMYYYKNEKELKDNNFSNAGQVILINCNDSLIRNLDLSHASIGIFLYKCYGNILTNLNTSHNYYGIRLDNSVNNTVSGNNATENNRYGIYLKYSNENTILRNDASNNDEYGIYLEYSYDNTISENIGTIAFYPNFPVIINYSPENNTIDVSTIATLSVVVFDFDGDLLTVEFYDASDDSLIDRVTDVLSGENVSVIWSGLSENTIYSWYVKVSDGVLINQSNTWIFKTVIPLNSSPFKPTNPSPANNTIDVSLSPTLSVDVSDPDGDSLDVYFFDASDDSLIGVVNDIPSGGRASVVWSGLLENRTYSWYVNVSDGVLIDQSNTWVFKTGIKLISEEIFNRAFEVAFQKALEKTFQEAFQETFESRLKKLIEKKEESLSQSQKLSIFENLIKNLIFIFIVAGMVGIIINKIRKKRSRKKTEPILK